MPDRGWGGSPTTDRPLEYVVDYRMWSDSYQRLDFEAQPQGYRLWKHQVRTFLLGRFPQVGSVLEWAEKQLEPIPAQGHPSA
eukprot:1142112-Alexandrium_andersonii.AAC.1